jgi:hypothetical protein
VLVAALSVEEKALVVSAALSALIAMIALFQLYFFNRSEARRTQPVAVLNQERSRDLHGRFGVSLTNHGTGTAFNVRVGVILDGIEYPLGEGDGNRYTVAPGERQPPNGVFELQWTWHRTHSLVAEATSTRVRSSMRGTRTPSVRPTRR